MKISLKAYAALLLLPVAVAACTFAQPDGSDPTKPESTQRSTQPEEDPQRASRPEDAQLSSIDAIVEAQIRAGNIPGAVVVVGSQGKTLYRKAFGHRTTAPDAVLPMTEDTVFDLASVTKAVATTTAILQLTETGKVRLDAPASRYWPEFRANGKGNITVAHLLTHYSGLRPDLDLRKEWAGYQKALRLIIAEKPVTPPGIRYVYSDINFEVLGELVQRVSGQPLDLYCAEHIFKPLGMTDTGFTPPASLRSRIAPTERSKSGLLQGKAHDPTAFRMGGVAGHAGLFGTADDLAVFAQMLLDGGSAGGVRILDRLTVEQMSSPQSPPGKAKLRGLGWDVAAPFAANRDDLPPVGSFGHTGFTGTLLWLDPITRTYVIVLTNRVYPHGKGDAGPLRKEILAAVSAALRPLSVDQILAARPSLTRHFDTLADRNKTIGQNRVASGVDVLAADRFAPLKGLRVGLITNHTGLDAAGNRIIDLLRDAPGVQLAALFSPEHGLYGNVDEKIASGMEPTLRLPVYSLYGDVKRPTDQMLEGIDALVFDIQDAGARFYTYISTMGYAMEAAAKKGIPLYVLDRPNPITASRVQGPVMDAGLKSFTGYFPLPVQHGMTVGELARLFNGEYRIGADLHVIRMRGYRRTTWYDDTGLPWINPSPNLRSLTEAALYPGVAMAEGANVSVGRGTDTPFELLGAPWMDADKLADYLNGRHIPGVRFAPVHFTPNENIYKDRTCHGVRITLLDRNALDAPALGVEIISALHTLHPADFQVNDTLGLIGARSVLQAVKDGEDPRTIARSWQVSLATFQDLRAKYLLY